MKLYFIKGKLMAQHNLTDIIHIHPLAEIKKKRSALLFSANAPAVDTFFVMASYDRLSVTVIIDGNLEDTKGRNASLGKGGERKDKREKPRRNQ